MNAIAFDVEIRVRSNNSQRRLRLRAESSNGQRRYKNYNSRAKAGLSYAVRSLSLPFQDHADGRHRDRGGGVLPSLRDPHVFQLKVFDGGRETSAAFVDLDRADHGRRAHVVRQDLAQQGYVAVLRGEGDANDVV